MIVFIITLAIGMAFFYWGMRWVSKPPERMDVIGGAMISMFGGLIVGIGIMAAVARPLLEKCTC